MNYTADGVGVFPFPDTLCLLSMSIISSGHPWTEQRLVTEHILKRCQAGRGALYGILQILHLGQEDCLVMLLAATVCVDEFAELLDQSPDKPDR